MPPKIKVVDESQDQKYFTITPRLVWAMSRNPYDFTLWATIKGIAGEAGECYLATPDLATLSMMSAGQASQSRKYWMGINLLQGDLRRDPGYPQPVWHLSIPNIWKANLEWAEKYQALKDRIEFKTAQKVYFDLLKKTPKESLHTVKPSPGEEGITPGEEGVSPDETKKINKEIKKDSALADAPARGMISPNTGRRTDAVVLGDEMDGLMYGMQLAASRNAEMNNRINDFPPDCQQTLRTLVEQFTWPSSIIPEKPAKSSKGGAYAQWIAEIRELNSMAGDLGQRVIIAASKESKDLSIGHPAGIKWAIGGEAGKLAKSDTAPVFTGVQTPFTQSISSRGPLDPEAEMRIQAMRGKLKTNA